MICILAGNPDNVCSMCGLGDKISVQHTLLISSPSNPNLNRKSDPHFNSPKESISIPSSHQSVVMASKRSLMELKDLHKDPRTSCSAGKPSVDPNRMVSFILSVYLYLQQMLEHADSPTRVVVYWNPVSEEFGYDFVASYKSGTYSRKRAMIDDTVNEIGGDGDIAHFGIGNARRMPGKFLIWICNIRDKYKWQIPESTQARRTRGRVTEEDPEMFGDDAILRPSGAPRKSKSQRSSASSSATSGSSKNRVTELMQEQILLDREAKKESMDRELAARLAVCEIQKRNEDLKILTFDTTGMNPEDAAKIEALKDKTRAAYFNF
ncbi:hypothetical protein Tco_0257783 [Tanacetum coccineum]